VHKNLRAIVRRSIALVFLSSTLVSFPSEAQTPSVITRGVQWLSSQVQADGTLQNEAQSIATPLQIRSEVYATLQLLTTVSSTQSASISANLDGNTEYLSRQIVALNSAGLNATTQLTQLASSNNSDGGYGGAPGYASTPLDTAFALIALKSGGSTATVSAALAYLQAAQQTDGSFRLNGVEDIYSSIYVLAAFHQYAGSASLGNNTQLLATYLMAQQSAPGTWNNSPFLSALAYSSLHDFIALTPTSTAISAYLQAGQQADGSWSDDPYITAVVLRALSLTSVTPANPGLAVVQGTIVDSQTGLPLTGVTVTLTLSGGTAANTFVTAADGTFTFGGLNAGNYAMSATLANYVSLSTNTSVSSGQALNFGTLQLVQNGSATTGTLRGIVTDAISGAPIGGATVSNATFRVKTDSRGVYQVANVAAGPVPITVSQTGYQTINTTGNLVAGGQLVYSPAMTTTSGGPIPTSATVNGVVVDAGTNLPLTGVAITATDGAGTHTAQSDANGNFSIGGMVGDANGGVSFTFMFAKYNNSATYVLITNLASVNIGQVRLRAIAASQLLPNLSITGINRSGAVTDPQSLNLSGQLSVTLQNQGSVDIPPGVQLLAFQDVNKNGVYDVGTDQALGNITLTTALPIGQNQVVQIPVQGTMPFRDAPITVWADSTQMLIESSPSNNIKTVANFMAPPPFVGPIQATLKWSWQGGGVISTPMVGPLTDTNGDGKYDANDIPTVLVIQALGIDRAPGMLTALSGKDGTQLWQVTDPTLYAEAESHAAIGILDAGGVPQAVIALHAGGVAVINHDGTLKCTSAVPVRTGLMYDAITIADLDGDGNGEILLRGYVLNNDCSVRFVLPNETNDWIFPIVVADLDGDGKPEIITRNTVYHNDGSLYWTFPPNAGGWITLAHVDPNDPHPQIVTNFNGVQMFRYDGTPMWGPVQIPSTNGNEGPATIVDLDGKGIPSIAIATADYYTVMNADGSIRWSIPTTDDSGVTGSTAFDFYQNGKAKIVYFDQSSLRVLDGANGNTLYSTPNDSGTATEYPVVADVDGSGHAAMLVISNSGNVACCGLRVFQDVNNAWPDTRKIWNEYDYHVTNVNDDGSLPKVERGSWNLNNNYRVNPPISNAQSDVSASYVRVNDQGGTLPSVVTVRIGNAGGGVISAGLKVGLYSGKAGGALLGTAVTSVDLNSDDYQDVTFSIPGSLSGISTLVAVADDDGTGVHTLNDFDIANNTVSLPLSALPGSFNLMTVTTDQTSYLSNTNVQIAATIANHGSFDGNVPLGFVVQNASGQQVAIIPVQVVAVAHLGQQTTNVIWNTGTIAAGSYTLIAKLLDTSGKVINQLSASFTISSGAPGAAQAGVTLTPDKLTYLPTDTVKLNDVLTNLTANTALNGLTIVTTVTNPVGATAFTQTESLAQLVAAASKSYTYNLPLNVAAAGIYHASVVVSSNGTTVSQATTQFTVASSATTGSGLIGSVTLGKQQVPLGNPLAITYSATNNGNSALTGLPLVISVIDPVAQKVIATFPTTQTIAMGTSYAGSDNWTSAGVVGNTYVAVLSATVGGNPMTLAQANFTLIASPIKLGITQALWNNNTALVLTNCNDQSGDDKSTRRIKDGSHNQGNDGDNDSDDTPPQPIACTAARYVAIDKTLTGLGLAHVMATNTSAFTFAMRTGLYNTLWVAGDQSQLGGDLTAEVSEVVYGGASLIVDGGSDQSDIDFDLLGGVKSRHDVSSNQNVILSGSFYPTAQTLPTVGEAQSLKVTSGGLPQASMTVTGGDGDNDSDDKTQATVALVSNVVGAGRTLIVGFDLGSSLATQATAWNTPLNNTLAALTPSATTSLTPGEVLPLQTSIANQANAVAVDVQTVLPAGALYLGSNPSATFASSTQTVDWDFNLAVAQSNSVHLSMRAPSTGGSYNLQTLVSTVNNGTDTAYGNPVLFPIMVTSAAATAVKASAALQAVTGKDQSRAKDAIANLNQAMSDFNLNTYSGYGKAIDELVEIAGSLSKFSIANTAPINAIHAAIDQILQEAQWRWSMAQPEIKVSLDADKAHYQPTDTIKLSDQVTNVTSLTLLNNLSVITTITDPTGASFFTKAEALTQFAVGEKQIYSYSIPMANAVLGNYAVGMTVVDANGITLAQSSAKFSVAKSE